MAISRRLRMGPRTALAGDGGLLMTSLCAAVAGLAILLGSGSHAANVIGGSAVVAAICLAPLLAWRLHRRPVDFSATGGAVLGYLAGWVALFALLILGALIARVVDALGLFDGIDDAQKAVGLILGVAIAVAYLAVAAWLCVDAVRDLSDARRAHVGLDVARLAATVVFIGYTVAVIATVATGSDTAAGVSTLLLLAVPGAMGAAVVTLADIMVRRGEGRSSTRLISGA